MKWVRALYFSNRFFILTGAIAALFVFSYFIVFLLPIAKALFLLWMGTAISDFEMRTKSGLPSEMSCGSR